MRSWERPWMKGTYGQRVSEVLKMENQQELYEIAFCDPLSKVRLAAVHRLNQMETFPRPHCYEYTGANFGSDDDPPYREWFDSMIYRTDVPKWRKGIIPYIISENFLFEIAMGDPNKSIAKCAANRIQDSYLLLRLTGRNYDFEVGRHAESLIYARKMGIRAKKPRPIPKIKTQSGKIPRKTPPMYWELVECAEMVKEYSKGFMHFRIKEADIDLAIVAMQRFGDTDLADALVRLYQNPDFAWREKIKRYDGTKIHGKIEYDEYWRETVPPAYLRLDGSEQG